jgi:hypothetical protein
MRLIDADALPKCWQPDCNGNRQFVDIADIDAASTVECEACEFFACPFVKAHTEITVCSNFRRRQP